MKVANKAAFVDLGVVNMRNIKLVIEYDGKEFNGWQKQPNKLNIQGTIEQAIEIITGEKVDLMASDRISSSTLPVTKIR